MTSAHSSQSWREDFDWREGCAWVRPGGNAMAVRESSGGWVE